MDVFDVVSVYCLATCWSLVDDNGNGHDDEDV